jgi:hypothetical protein
MSRSLIARSPDLARLASDGYEISVVHGNLLLHHVPYVTPAREVAYGILVAPLSLAGDVTVQPPDHVVRFQGEMPCNSAGSPLTRVVIGSTPEEVAPGIAVHHMFSSKPDTPHPDYYAKMTSYVLMLEGHAQAIDSTATARTYFVPNDPDDDSVFEYTDSASTRAGIVTINERLKLGRVAIVGLGGTGSYILDLVAKTPVREIHLYDGDRFLQHNAFRAPGAASIERLREAPPKADYWAEAYRPMRRGIVAHPYFLDEDSLSELDHMDFVFMSLEGGEAKRLIVERLERAELPFIDVGLGVQRTADALVGVLAITTSTPEMREHVHSMKRIDFAPGAAENEYDLNIQIADLNALNAALAVVRWKRLFGVYTDLEGEHYSAYTTDGNFMLNEDQS